MVRRSPRQRRRIYSVTSLVSLNPTCWGHRGRDQIGQAGAVRIQPQTVAAAYPNEEWKPLWPRNLTHSSTGAMRP